MSKILYIQASPRRGENGKPGRSHSIQAAKAFIDAYCAKHPDTEVETLDVFSTPLPQFDDHLLNARYNITHGRDHSEAERAAWAEIEVLIARVASADVLVFAVPMWNFSIPYRLKHFIDLICQPTYTFSAGPEGYSGLLESKAFVAYARGGEYPLDTPMADINFQSPYLEFILGFIGVTPVRSVAVEPTLGDPELRQRVKEAAARRAAEIAEEF